MSVVIAPQLRALRLSQGKSCRTLAREVGISASYLSDLETGKRDAPPAMLKRLAAVLGVPVEAWLLAWAEANVDGEVLAAVRGQG